MPLLLTAAVLLALGPACRFCPADDVEAGFVRIFDGATLDGWDGDPKLWRVVDGAITGETTDDDRIEDNQFLIWEGEVGDFILRTKFRVDDRGVGNSGIQYRSRRYPNAGKWIVGGYQADIERTNKYMGILYEERGRGILALRGEKVVLRPSDQKFEKKVVGSVGDADEIVRGVKAGEWQDYEIEAHGNRLSHRLNGRTTIEVIDADAENSASRGLIALQVHRGDAMRVQFRDVRLKDLSTSE